MAKKRTAPATVPRVPESGVSRTLQWSDGLLRDTLQFRVEACPAGSAAGPDVHCWLHRRRIFQRPCSHSCDFRPGGRVCKYRRAALRTEALPYLVATVRSSHELRHLPRALNRRRGHE